MAREALSFVGCLLAAVALACGGGGSGSGTAASSLPVTATAGHLPPELQSVVDAMEDTQTAAAEFTFDGPGALDYGGSIEFAAPDRLHVKLADTQEAKSELIVLGEQYFMRFAGDWFASTLMRRPAEAPATGDEQAFQMLRGGTATVNGKQCQLYTFAGADSGKAERAPAGTLQLCIAEDRVQRAVLQLAGSTLTVHFRYDVPVQITAPETGAR